MVAAFILLRLRSELGKKTGNEPLPPAAGRGPVVDGESRDASESQNTAVVDMETDPALRRVYSTIRKFDSSFDPAAFRDGARNAYGMILEAFWSGDRDTLKNLLDDDVYAQFTAAIDDRADKGLTLENKLLDITDVDVVKGHMEGNTAELTVKLTSEVVAVTRDSDGEIVDGDPSDAATLHDKWTFARDLTVDDYSWKLIATRAGA